MEEENVKAEEEKNNESVDKWVCTVLHNTESKEILSSSIDRVN